jgi:hypothetical protein
MYICFNVAAGAQSSSDREAKLPESYRADGQTYDGNPTTPHFSARNTALTERLAEAALPTLRRNTLRTH